jgi:hypothetical protein
MATTVTPSTTAANGTTPRTTETDTQSDRPDVAQPAYGRMQRRWNRCRDLMAETDAIHDGGETYMKRLEGESDQSYEVRRTLCAVFNGFKRTVIACVGLILEKRPTLGEDMPPKLKALWENVDRGGKHGAVWTREAVTDAMIDGHVGGLVEYPRVRNPDAVSDDDEQQLGLRPYWIKIEAKNIYKALYANIDGVIKLVLLSVREDTEERVGRFGIRTVTRYRVYLRETTRVTCEVWKVPETSGGTPTPEGTAITLTNLKEIPFAKLVAGQVISINETMPPLINLADLNLEHHRVKTEIHNICGLACIPTPVRVGAQPIRNATTGEMEYPPVILGPRNTIEVPAGPGNDFKFVSPDVAVVEPHRQNLEDIKVDMGAAGLAFLAPDTRAAETAEAKRIDAAAQNATLSTLASNLKDFLELMFQHTGAYMTEKSGSVDVNTDFEGTIMEPSVMQALGSLSAQGRLSIETLLKELERGKRLPEGFAVDEELRRILAEGALREPSTPPTNDNPNDTPPNDPGN